MAPAHAGPAFACPPGAAPRGRARIAPAFRTPPIGADAPLPDHRDDPDNARYIADGLRELGWFATVARDGPDGMARACGEAWDLIVLDRMLPHDVDGLSILTTLRGLGRKIQCWC